jgi:hypothetical protein
MLLKKSLQKMMAPSSSFKNKREKHSPIRLKNPILRDKIESINKLQATLTEQQ